MTDATSLSALALSAAASVTGNVIDLRNPKKKPLAATALNDTFYGSSGSDTFNAGNGNDLFWGYAGNDILVGGNGHDTIYGGDGNDALYGGLGNDSLYGDAGNDSLFGGGGADNLFGGSGNDYLVAKAGTCKMFGDAGYDTIQASDGATGLFSGDDGDDVFWIKDANGTVLGGSGNDKIDLSLVEGGKVFYANGTDARYYFGASIDMASGYISFGETNSLFANNFEEIVGSNFGDIFIASGGQIDYNGGGGDDWFYAALGNDTYSGGAGNDTYIFSKRSLISITSTFSKTVEYTAGHDQIVVETDSNFKIGNVITKGKDLIIYFNDASKKPYDAKIIVKNGAAAFKDGLLGIAESKNGSLNSSFWQANSGSQFLSGAAKMVGGAQNDIIQYAGNSGGNDGYDSTMTGGAGADHFVMNYLLGNVTITDFNVKEDRLEFWSSSNVTSTNIDKIKQVGADLVLALEDPNGAWGFNLTLNNVKRADFLNATKNGHVFFS